MEAPSVENCEWLQTWKTESGELMDAGYTIQVVLADDKSKIFASVDKPYLEVQKWAVSVQFQDNTSSWDKKTFKFYRVAPTEDIYYHPEIGASDPKRRSFYEKNLGTTHTKSQIPTEKVFKLSLWQPFNTPLHRAGLAGLYMSLAFRIS